MVKLPAGTSFHGPRSSSIGGLHDSPDTVYPDGQLGVPAHAERDDTHA